MEIDRGSGIVLSGHWLGNTGDVKTFGRSLVQSPQGGLLIMGSMKEKFGTFQDYISEMTSGFRHPLYKLYRQVAPGTLQSFEAQALLLSGSVSFQVYDMTGYKSISFNNLLTTSTVPVQSSIRLDQDQCVSKLVTPDPTRSPTMVPSTQPSTDAPSTAAPSCQPSTLTPSATVPSQLPSTLRPTVAGETNEPTVFPTVAPTSVPTVNPTLLPTATPSSNPTTETPSTHIPTTVPSECPTLKPTNEPSTNHPSTLLPTVNPTLDPTLDPTALPTEASIQEIQSAITLENNVVLSSLLFATSAVIGLCLLFACCKFRGKVELNLGQRKNRWQRRGSVSFGNALFEKRLNSVFPTPGDCAVVSSPQGSTRLDPSTSATLQLPFLSTSISPAPAIVPASVHSQRASSFIDPTSRTPNSIRGTPFPNMNIADGGSRANSAGRAVRERSPPPPLALLPLAPQRNFVSISFADLSSSDTSDCNSDRECFNEVSKLLNNDLRSSNKEEFNKVKTQTTPKNVPGSAEIILESTKSAESKSVLNPKYSTLFPDFSSDDSGDESEPELIEFRSDLNFMAAMKSKKSDSSVEDQIIGLGEALLFAEKLSKAVECSAEWSETSDSSSSALSITSSPESEEEEGS